MNTTTWPMTTSASALAQAVVPTARAIRWTPPLVMAGLLAGVGALSAAADRPMGSILVVAAVALAATVVGALNDPARSLLEALPVTAMQRRMLRLGLVGLPALALWGWLSTTVPQGEAAGVGPLVALTAVGTAALVWAPPGRALAIGITVPVVWYILGTVAPASGPVATVAEAWWEHPWPVAAVAVALCVLGRSR
jgi:hypothetical protein